MKRQKHARISQCMIVKNEEKNIEQALSWGKGVVSEQIVVDTGSTDRTVEIAERMGAKVYHFQWIDDFSAAKNFAISKARYEWIALLDADEYFSEEDARKLKYYVEVLQNEKCDGIMAAWVQLDNAKRVMAIHTQIRIFRNVSYIRYANRIHECLAPTDGRRLQMYDATKELSILHTGYGELESKAKRESGRNLKLILAELEENPDNYEMQYYLGNEYESLRQWDKAEEAYRKSVALMPEEKRGIYDATDSGCYFRLLELLAARPGTDQAELLEYYRQAVTGWPKEADYDYVIGTYYAGHGNYLEGEKHLKRSLELLDQYGNFYGASKVSARLMSAYELLATCCYNNKNLTECVKLATAVLKENPYYMSTVLVLLSAFRQDMTRAGKGREGAMEVAAFLGRAFYDLGSLRDRLFLLKGARAANYLELEEIIRGLFSEEEWKCVEIAEKKRNLRIVLFYSSVESFNFFSDQLADELQKRGHSVFILDLDNPPEDNPHSYQNFNQFALQGVDGVISFDGIGTREDENIEMWNKLGAAAVNILMDAPFRFHPSMSKHPRKYHMFCCDLEHVEYMKKYFSREVSSVSFMPHVGAMPKKDAPVIPYGERKYDVLFSGTYYRPQDQFDGIKEHHSADSKEYHFYQVMYENLIKNSHLTIEQAVLVTLEQLNWAVSNEDELKLMINKAGFVDWAIRMYQRERVVSVLAEAGIELYLLGRGWENHPSAHLPNVHRIDDRVPYGQTLDYMANAKINLNVMPWFKEGTHDRIFNTLLQRSVPLTDSSTWIDRNFTDGEDIALYDLEHLDKLPDIVKGLLSDTEKAESIIRKGYEKVSQKFTWSHCTDWVLEAIIQAK